jgi:hypothetical protein
MKHYVLTSFGNSLRKNANLDSSGSNARHARNRLTLLRSLRGLAAAFGIAAATTACHLAVNTAAAEGVGLNPEFNQDGNILISDQFNNRVIQVNHDKQIVADYGLPLDGGGAIGNNLGYDLDSTQKGLYSPYDAKIVGDYTGITAPFFDGDFGGFRQ